MWASALIAMGVLGLLKLIVFNSTPAPKSISVKTIASGTQWFGDAPTTSFNAELAKRARDRQPIPEWLVNEAMREAYDAGDWEILRALSRTFDQERDEEPVNENPENPVNESPENPPAQPMIVIGKNSPIYGVTNDDWSAFVDKLETKAVDYKDDKHVGAYYHHKNRLTEIGVNAESLTDKQAQYNALETDLKDVLSKYKKLINDWSGDVLTINGQTTSITRSGILGLIKAAGAEGASGWLKNEQQRTQYPMTTELFLRTNGMF